MSGQRQQSFDLTPTKQPHVGSMADAPQFGTTPYQVTAARFVNDGRGMAAIGSALSSFFDAGAKTAETVAQIQHREELVQTQRENEALRKQGIADQGLGKPLDPEHEGRRDYLEAYQTSAADAQAHQISEGLREHLAKLPLDGSEDFGQAAEDYIKGQIGTGTGDAVFDSRLIAQVSRNAEAQVAQLNEGRRSTVIQNNTKDVFEQFAKRVLSPEGISTPQFAEMRNRLLPLVHGNTVMRDKLMLAAISGAVQNDGQGASVLRAMEELGLDKSEPETFNRISGEVLKRTNAVKTFDAGLAVQNFQKDIAIAKGQSPGGILTPERVLEFAARARDIDGVHGVGPEVFGLNVEFARARDKKAQMNLWTHTLSGVLGTQDSRRVAAMYGKSPATVMNEHYDTGMSAWASAQSPVLAATVDGTGLINPMKSPQAAQAYAELIVAGGPNAGHRAASQDTISDTFKASFGSALVGRDANAIVTSYGFYDRLAGSMTREQLRGYFQNDAAENMYYAMKSVAQGPEGLRQLARTLADNPTDAKLLGDTYKTGKANLSLLAREFGVSQSAAEIDALIVKARADAILEGAGRKEMWGNLKVSMDSNEEAAFEALVVQQFLIQRAATGTVDVEKAVRAVAGQTGKFILVPGLDGTVQAVRSPFKGAGLHMGNPLNADPSHPLSTTKGYSPIYSPGAKIMNAWGDEEDTLVTWAEDAKAAHKALPGKIAEHDTLYLQRPNAAGLSQVRASNGAPVIFRPGEKVALRTRDRTVLEVVTFNDTAGLEHAEVPKDPEGAQTFFREKLPPGWFAIAEMGAYVMYYGARVKKGTDQLDEAVRQRGEFQKGIRDRGNSADRPTELPGGAVMSFPNAPKKAAPPEPT